MCVSSSPTVRRTCIQGALEQGRRDQRPNVSVHLAVLIGKDPDAGKDWGQEEKGTTEDETVGWHH